MGLDTVEIIMRTEEVLGVELPNDECGRLRTVGDLYCLVLSKLQLLYVPSIDIEAQALGRDLSRPGTLNLVRWSSPDVWLTLKGIILDQLQVDTQEITETATFLDDLRCD